MITHVVLFKLKEPTPENLRTTADVLRAMDGRIPELLTIDVGIDQLQTPRSFHIALRTTHRTWAELDAYQAHPVHEEVLVHMRNVLDRSVAVDYES